MRWDNSVFGKNNKRSWMLLWVCLIIGLSVLFPVVAQNDVRPALLENDIKVCPEETITVSWPETVKNAIQARFQLETSMPSNNIVTVNHEIREGEDNITIYETASFTHTKESRWNYLIKTLVTTKSWCTYVTQKTVGTYDKVITYIGPGSDEFQLASQSFQSTWTYLDAVIVELEWLQLEEEAKNLLSKNVYSIQNADILLIDSQTLWVFLSTVPQLQETVGLTLLDQDVFVISSINQSAFRRLVATYHSIVWIKELSVIPRNNVGSLLSWLLLGKDPVELGIAKKFSIDRGWQWRWLVVSSIVDKLLSNGVPLNWLLLILLIPVLVLSVTVFRQVIWFSTYGTFNALFIAFALHLLWLYSVLVLLLAALVVVRVISLFTNKVYLLSGSRIALTIALYTILILWILVVDMVYFDNTITQSWGVSWMTIFPIYYVLITGSSLFKDRGSIFSRKRWTKLLQYAIVLWVLLVLIRWNWLHNLLLWYPELIILACILTVIVWRFTWLQVTEYLRFMPLISWTLSEEEEE